MKILFILSILFTSHMSAKELDKVSVQFHWLDQFEYAGYYAAKEKGFYKDLGLDVTLKNYKYGMNVANEVLNNKATYAIGGSDLIVNMSKKAKIKLLFATFQSSPLILLTTPKSGIKSIKDFKDKRIMLTPDVMSSVTFNAMMKKEGMSMSDMFKQEHSFDVDDLINQKTDLLQSYISNEPFALKQQDIEPIIFDPKESGFDLYSDIVFTSDDEIKNHKQRASNFREATLKGWQYAFDNIEETVNIILKKYNSQNRSKEALVYEAKELKKLAFYGLDSKDQLGYININTLQRIYDLHNLMGLAKGTIDFNDFIFKMQETTDDLKRISLTKQEKNYLYDKGTIKMCIVSDWKPYESFDENGKHIGMTADYFAIFKKQIPIGIEIVQTNSWSQTLEFVQSRKCDIISLAMQTSSRKKYLDFTSPYVEVPLVLVTKLDKYFIDDLKTLRDEKIGISRQYGFFELIKVKYPNLNIVEIDNMQDGLEQVVDGKLFGYIGSVAAVGNLFQNKFPTEIKVSGKFDERLSYSVAVRNDDTILLEIFEKLVSNISQTEKQKILNNWIAIRYEKGTDYDLLFKVIAGIFLVFIFFIYRHYILGQKIKIEIEKSRKKDNLMFQQNKMASLGNMIEIIAHQWRQPLSELAMSQNVTLRQLSTSNSFSKDELQEIINDEQKIVQFMSSTINTFQDFYKEDADAEECKPSAAYYNVKYILSESMYLNNIQVVEDIQENISINSYYNYLSQVILSILQNSIYFLKHRNITAPIISVSIKEINGNIQMKFEDNAGGIDKDIIKNIFDYNFSQRDKSDRSTGLGLYISKLIIEDKLHGKIEAVNTQKGVSFSISFSSEKED